MHNSRVLFVILLLAMLGGCGIGYELAPARLAIVDVSHDGYAQVAATVHDLMIKEGFEDFGRAEEMMSLIRSNTEIPDKMNRELLARFDRERTYLNHRRDLRVVLSNYVDGVPPEVSLRFARPSDHFVELEIFNEHPVDSARMNSPSMIGSYPRFEVSTEQLCVSFRRRRQPMRLSIGASHGTTTSPPLSGWRSPLLCRF